MTPYEKAQQTLHQKRFGGDVEKMNAWKKARNSKGGKKSGNRPFKNKDLAKSAGKSGADKRWQGK